MHGVFVLSGFCYLIDNMLENLEKRTAERAAYFKELGLNLRKTIDSMVQPIGHGTTSDNFPLLMQSQGLGAELPESSYAFTKSAIDLRYKDGLLAAYLFARVGKTDDLELRSESLTGKDAIQRYIELNPVSEQQLRQNFRQYTETRKPTGYPIVLIYDGQNQVQTEHNNPDYPCELEFQGVVAPSSLKVILAPFSRLEEVRASLSSKNLKNVELLPAEILEVAS